MAEDIRTLKKYWGWLSDVVNAAHLLLTRRLNNSPQMFMENIHGPACVRASHFIECCTVGFDGRPLPVIWCSATTALYAWFVHDVQRAEGISDGYFSVRWMEPR